MPGGGIGKLHGGGAQIVGYDLATGKLTPIRDPLTKGSVPVSYNLATIQGGGEVMFELVPLLGRKDFATAWLQYCRIGGAPADVLKRDQSTGTEGNDARYILNEQSGPRLAAYAYFRTKDFKSKIELTTQKTCLLKYTNQSGGRDYGLRTLDSGL